MNWTDERVTELRRMAADGLYASEAAAELGSSRNAILGAAFRHKITFGGGSRDAYRRHRQNPRKPRQVVPKAPAVTQPSQPKTNPAPVSASPDARHRCGLLELTNASCRFVVSGDGPPFEFCGAPEADFPDVPYCPHHARIVYRRPGEREEAA